MNSIEIGSLLYDYALSSDGTELRLLTDKGTVLFRGICSLSIGPTPQESRLPENTRDIDIITWYKTADHIRTTREFYDADHPTATVVAVGPPSLRAVYNATDKKHLKSLGACFILADGLEVSLIFESVTVESSPNP